MATTPKLHDGENCRVAYTDRSGEGGVYFDLLFAVGKQAAKQDSGVGTVYTALILGSH